MPIRYRLAIVFMIAWAIVFAAGGWLLVSQLASSQLGSIDAQLTARLTQADRYLPASAVAPVPAGSPVPGEYVVQVLDPSGVVRGASADAGSASLLTGSEFDRARYGRLLLTTSLDGERERVMAEPLAARPGWIAVAGVSLEAYDGTLSEIVRGLLISGLVFVVAAGLGAYGLARAALSPVERMRQEVAALSERDEAPGVQVPRTRDEIAALATTMNALLARLDSALSRQRALVADASHELRTPFAVLSAELELAARPGRSREELATAVARAGEEVARLIRITDQLLFLARSDEDRITPRREQTPVGPLLARSEEQAAGRAQLAGVRCRVDVPAGLMANVDADRLREAIDNLVDNALRFAPPGTEILLSANAVGTDLVIEVSDAGPGFPAEFLPHAFERFARPDSGRARDGGGAGLGLAIVSAIAQAHGGRATVGNQAAGGATIALELPDAASLRGSG